MTLQHHKVIPLLIIGLLVFIPEVTHADFLQKTLWDAVNGIFGTILGLTAWFFDIAINRFVIGFAGEYTTSGIGIAIDGGWALVRDLMNLLFIFGLLYIGFKIILSSDDSSTRTMLVNLIVAALLINFSLFITKFVVDGSNALASQIAISGFYGQTIASPYSSGEQIYQVEMATDVMARMGMSTLYQFDNNTTGRPTNDWGYIFGVAILLIVASFVFMSGAILLLIRFLALNFFMLLSPLMFVGWAFPPLARYTSWYWKAFLGRAFFAPVYFLLIYFSLSIVTTLGSTRGVAEGGLATSLGADIIGAGSGAELAINSPSSFPYFVISVGAMLFALFAAQKLGADGASTAINIGNNMRRSVQNTVKRGAVGTGRFAARNTAGVALRGTQNVSGQVQRKYQRLDARLAKSKSGRALRGIANVATLGATSDKAMQAGFSKVAKARVAGSETHDEYTKRGAEITNRQNKLQGEIGRTKDIKDAYFNYPKDLKKINDTSLGKAVRISNGEVLDIGSESEREAHKKKLLSDRDAKISGALGKMSDEEIKNLINDSQFLNKQGGLGNAGNIFKESFVAKHLKDSQMKTLADSGLLRKKDIDDIKAASSKGNIDDILEIQQQVGSSADELSESIEQLGRNIKNMSKEQLSGVKFETLKKEGVAMHLKTSDIDNLRESGKLTNDQLKSIIDSKNSAFEKIAEKGTHLDAASVPAASEASFKEDQRNKLFKASVKEVGNYPVAVFSKPESYEYLSPEMMSERLKNGVSKKEIKEMRDAFLSSGGTSNKAWEKWENGNSTHAAQFFN